MENFFELEEIIETEEEFDFTPSCDDDYDEDDYDEDNYDDSWAFARDSYHYNEDEDEYYDEFGERADYVEGATAAWWDDAMEK